jgi:glycosyltransferase involved in cell wall biosynthesis
LEPLVSIIIPLYNSEIYISDTLDSILNQTYKNYEILIINDMSKDNGEEIIKNYQKKFDNIFLINLEVNSGAGVARNKGIELAKGKYIAFIDSDDLWKKNKLEKQIKYMEDNNYYFTFTKYEQINESDEFLKEIKVPNLLTYKKELYYNHIGTSTVIYNQEKLGKIYMPVIRKRQDYAMWLKILKNFSNGYGLQEVLTTYRIRNNSISSNKINLIKYNWKLYRDVENMNFIRSSYYLMWDILSKVLKIK